MGQQALQAVRTTSIRTNSGKRSANTRSDRRDGYYEIAEPTVDPPAVRGKGHEPPDIVAVSTTGDSTALGTWCAGPRARGGDGNVCRGKLLLPDDHAGAIKKPPHIPEIRRQAAAKGFAASRKTPPNRGSLAPTFRETRFYPGDSRRFSTCKHCLRDEEISPAISRRNLTWDWPRPFILRSPFYVVVV